MKKKSIIGLILVCILSVLINIFQSYKIKEYKSNEKYYTQMFKQNFDVLEQSFDLYNGSGALTNESAIKNSVGIVENLKSIRELSSYRENKATSEMLLYLSQFFVLNSDEYINENIDKVKSQLKEVSKDLDNEKSIKDFNEVLWKMVSKNSRVKLII